MKSSCEGRGGRCYVSGRANMGDNAKFRNLKRCDVACTEQVWALSWSKRTLSESHFCFDVLVAFMARNIYTVPKLEGCTLVLMRFVFLFSIFGAGNTNFINAPRKIKHTGKVKRTGAASKAGTLCAQPSFQLWMEHRAATLLTNSSCTEVKGSQAQGRPCKKAGAVFYCIYRVSNSSHYKGRPFENSGRLRANTGGGEGGVNP